MESLKRRESHWDSLTVRKPLPKMKHWQLWRGGINREGRGDPKPRLVRYGHCTIGKSLERSCFQTVEEVRRVVFGKRSNVAVALHFRDPLIDAQPAHPRDRDHFRDSEQPRTCDCFTPV